jgi:hypothetical protein
MRWNLHILTLKKSRPEGEINSESHFVVGIEVP